MSHQLTIAIHPPFKPSLLSIPPSPFSPRSPLIPPTKFENQSCSTLIGASTTSTIQEIDISDASTTPAPSAPLPWLWTCHSCSTSYPLGATRRCLVDGHRFCAGTTVIKRWRNDGPRSKIKKHRACGSEFDYVGWRSWGRWRQTSPSSSRSRIRDGKVGKLSIRVESEKTQARKSCWRDCDYPSMCRWGKRAGIWTPTPTKTTFDVPSTNMSVLSTPMKDMPTLDDCFATSPPPMCEDSAGAFGRALEASAKRRKSVGCTSPTSALEESFPDQTLESCQTVEPFDAEMLDADETPSTTSMACIDPVLLGLMETSHMSPSTVHSGVTEATSPISSSRAMNKIRSLLSDHKRSSQRSRLRRSTLTLQKPLALREEFRAEGFSPLERVKTWNEGAVNVA